MNKRIMNKLRSQTGASISFALLLFLVCTVLCSVILTAATAASGRMSGIAEADQRYYAVTSAAALLKEEINGKSVMIEKISNGTRTENYKSDGSGSTSISYGDYELWLNSDKVEESSLDIKFRSITEDAAYKYYRYILNSQPIPTEKLRLKLKSSDELKSSDDFKALDLKTDPLDVDIAESIDNAGNITLTVGNNNLAEGKSYKIELVFSASVSGPTVSETEGESTSEVTSNPDDPDDTEVTSQTDMIKTETTILTWTLTGIKANP